MAAKKFNAKIPKEAEKYLSQGYSQRALIAHLRISHSTHNAWRKKHESYDAAILRGISKCEAFYIDKGLKMIDGTSKGSFSCLAFFMKNILRWKDNVESEEEKQTISISFNRLD